MKILVLAFDAPLASFGAPIIDQHGKTADFPGQSMLAGLIANALGYDHTQSQKLQRLQERITAASRQETPGELIVDYQTVDLRQEHMTDSVAWTTKGSPDSRKGAVTREGAHQRYRHYLAGSLVLTFLSLVPAGEPPTIDEVEEGLLKPERPLFIGRKCSLPSRRILHDVIEQPSLLEAMKRYPPQSQDADKTHFIAQWPETGDSENAITKMVTDERDWQNQVHCGQRLVRQGRIRYG